MADSYTRQSTFTDGDVVRAEHGNDEFNQLVRAFSEVSGHNHDGTVQGGAKIPLIEDLSGTHDISLSATGVTGSVILDEDDMVTDSAERLATQQSIKAYVDANSVADQAYADGLDAANRTWTSTEISNAVTGGVGGLVDTVNTWTALQTFSVVPRATLDPAVDDDLTRRSWVLNQITTGLNTLNLTDISNGIEVYTGTAGSGIEINNGTTDNSIISKKGNFSMTNQLAGGDLNLQVTTDDSDVDTPISITAGATAGTSVVGLKYGDTDRLKTNSTGVQVLGDLVDDNSHTYRPHRILRNSSSITIQGSLGTGSKITELWQWTTGGTYSLTEDTFAVGDKVVLYKLYETCPTLTVVTDTGSFYYNGNDEGDTMTMNVDYRLKMECLKVDTSNWIITGEVI